MLNLLGSVFDSQWFLIIIFVVAIGALSVLSLGRRKKEESYRNELNDKIVKGAKVKTYGGLYGVVESITHTSDGKIVLIKTGSGDKISYQTLHINAIFGIDEKENLVMGKDGNYYTKEVLREIEQEELEEQKLEQSSVEVEEKTAKSAKKSTKK